ncbi:MAG: DUF11 domain-containing protein, partial [Defluviitaleaceae bacterium]|nr:DUF11 domain-containing protein [Defluviitaleaceae bacterium]
YTLQNIATDISYQNNNVWWRIADHTEGNETGRMMIINGANEGAVFFQANVSVIPNTYYLFSTWILNMVKIEGRVDPQLAVRITSGGTVLFEETLGGLIPPNLNEPEWEQIGTLINSMGFSTLTVNFLSTGGAASGNDFAIDDVGLFSAVVTPFVPVKSATPTNAAIGDEIDFTVSFTNGSEFPMTNNSFIDPIPTGLEFVSGSVEINGVSFANNNPNIGFPLPDLAPGETVVVTFRATVVSLPPGGVAVNTATVTYHTPLVEGGLVFEFISPSNPVPITIGRDIFQSITDTILSVAMQEVALAHILNAEGEKLQAAIQMEEATVQDLIDINNSAVRLVSRIENLISIMQGKLETVLRAER